MLPRMFRVQRGFSLLEILIVVSLITIVSGIALPTLTAAADRMKLGQSAREVERELQTAKARAVGKGRPIRVRFNCPAMGEYRLVELIGTPAVPAAARFRGQPLQRGRVPVSSSRSRRGDAPQSRRAASPARVDGHVRDRADDRVLVRWHGASQHRRWRPVADDSGRRREHSRLRATV